MLFREPQQAVLNQKIQTSQEIPAGSCLQIKTGKNQQEAALRQYTRSLLPMIKMSQGGDQRQYTRDLMSKDSVQWHRFSKWKIIRDERTLRR
jgi:hypothetical protein